MEFVQLTDKEFDEFVESQQTGSFLQSSAMGRRRTTSGWSTHRVGVKDDGTVRAAALLNSRVVFAGYSDVECLQGPVMDYNNPELVRFFCAELVKYLTLNKALSFVFNPKVLANHRDADANIVDDGYSGEGTVRLLESLGFRHLDNAEVDANPLYLRWYFAKDLSGIDDAEQLMASFDQQAVRSVRKNLKTGIEVAALAEDELDEFFAVMRHTGERRGFDYRDEDYYRTLARFFGPEHITFLAARLDVPRYEKDVQRQADADTAALAKAQAALNAADDALAESAHKKLVNKLSAAQQAWDSSQSKLAELDRLREDGPRAVLAAAVFITFAGETVFLAGGSYDHYSQFYASYALHWEAMQHALSRGVKRYNFYGTKGDFSGNPDQQGVYRFKRGFGGVVEEQIGYFVFTPRPMAARVRSAVSAGLAAGRGLARKLLRR
ncbi:peptidoglycan bridge formation glycyltransferase FemA/FemB family protein [Psychromicrobium xiongbiense]|uniref:peptidoglycan bridge formation glycyltransferase FemA/FemB family protein n=1 Tax=Psychromicrobium xiongbiense TaxID=3051184 RepID=UPI002557C403|nr:peptidoglycan bridge formation glycyltransferase FemA/FemB family protein [Psychromicrobium sp. YIM S02556]